MKALIVCLSIVLVSGGLLMMYQPPLREDLPTIAVVFGYHFFLTKEISPENYASRIAGALARFSDVRCVVLSGANTRPGDSPLSEAQVLKREFQRLGILAPILLDEKARTTIDNIRNSASLVASIEMHLPRTTQVVLFSDSFQRPRIWWYVGTLFANRRMSLVGVPLWKERLQWQAGVR